MPRRKQAKKICSNKSTESDDFVIQIHADSDDEELSEKVIDKNPDDDDFIITIDDDDPIVTDHLDSWEEEAEREQKRQEEKELYNDQNETLYYEIIDRTNFRPPVRASDKSASYDVFATTRQFIPPNGKRYKMPLGCRWIFPDGYHGHYVMRSGLAASKGIEIAGGYQIVNADFPFEASIYLFSSPANNKGKGHQIEVGDRIVQLELHKTFLPQVRELPKN
jgi:dUTPase